MGATCGCSTPLALAPCKDAARPRRRQHHLLIGLSSVLILVIVVVVCHSGYPSSLILGGYDTAHGSTTEAACGAHAAPGVNESSFTKTPVDSTVLMLYSPSGTTERFCYTGAAGEGSNVEQEFLRVAASYVSSPYEGPAGAYYNFFAAHHATLWTVDAATRVATPMRLDVVYTFVSPTAPSFRRNLKARRVPLEQRRYRDWEELRYSLRSLRQFVFASGAFAQYHHRHAADVQRLSELGYQVNVSDAGAVDGVVSLVRHVYLVLSDTDQMPAWLDTERFPELRVVTHADMFSAEEAAWVLPTLNSNVIESGLHRIPGISRFFLYFNNDMIVGRQLSFFDLFRPLSPPRQILEMANLQQADGVAGIKTAQPYSDDTRVALFFETIFNSDGYVPPPSRSTLARIGARLVPQSWCAHLADVRPTGGLADRALRLLCTPAKISRPEQRGDALNHFARYCVQEELPGIVPSIEYAHMPRTFDREVLRMFSDDPISGFGVAVKEMRKAYIRDMNSFSPVHIYESFALAMRRARTAALWCQSDVRCAASLRPMHPLTTRKWRQRRTASCPGHPLEGGSQAVRLQHSDMLARWNSYEEKWLSSITTLPTSATETSQGSLSRSGVSAQNTATSLSASAPKQLYEPSQVVRMLLSERTARAPHKVSYQMISGCQHGGPVDASRVQSLVLDVHHHVSIADLTFSFFIVEDFQRLAIILSHLEHIAGNGTAPRASTLPLFITVNDDLESGVLDKQLHENHLMGWNRSHLTHAAFRRLLWLCSYMAPQAPWELWPARA